MIHTTTKRVQKSLQEFKKIVQREPELFVSIWIALFLFGLVILVYFGIAPGPLIGTDGRDAETPRELDATIVSATPPTVVAEQYESERLFDDPASAPVRVIIDAIGVNTVIQNPTSRDPNVLNEALLSGAVHYPGSGNLEDTSNMFLFGHSSHLPVVNNQAFKAFNDLEDLKAGDLIRVQSQTKEYHYRVGAVTLVAAEDAWVQFDSDVKKLTLSTCDNFGSAQDRHVVEAEFIGSFTRTVN